MNRQVIAPYWERNPPVICEKCYAEYIAGRDTHYRSVRLTGHCRDEEKCIKRRLGTKISIERIKRTAYG